MNIKKYIALLVALVMLLCLISCGAANYAYDKDASMEMVQDSVSEGGYEGADTEASGSTDAVLSADQKLVRNIWISAETEILESLLSSVEQKVAELGGYVEAREQHNYNSGDRWADLTIRIPAEKLNQFTETVQENANVTSITEDTDDITLSYVAVESRVKALETEHERLLELLTEAENMTDLLLIEERLTTVRAELEEVTTQLRIYDNQVDYGTVNLSVYEVKEYTEAEPEGFFARIGSGLKDSVMGIGNGFVELVIFLVVASPYLVLIALVAGAVVFIVKRRKKRPSKKEKTEE